MDECTPLPTGYHCRCQLKVPSTAVEGEGDVGGSAMAVGTRDAPRWRRENDEEKAAAADGTAGLEQESASVAARLRLEDAGAAMVFRRDALVCPLPGRGALLEVPRRAARRRAEGGEEGAATAWDIVIVVAIRGRSAERRKGAPMCAIAKTVEPDSSHILMTWRHVARNSAIARLLSTESEISYEPAGLDPAVPASINVPFQVPEIA